MQETKIISHENHKFGEMVIICMIILPDFLRLLYLMQQVKLGDDLHTML